jgi:hypothetical protein
MTTDLDLSQATWRKASRSVHNGGCVEIAGLPAAVALRDSKRPGDGVHVVTRAAFAALRADVKNGRFGS